MKLLNEIKNFGVVAGAKLKEASPEIALGVSIVCGVAAVATAIVAGTKIKETVDEAEAKIEEIETGTATEATKEEAIKKVKKEAAVDIMKHSAIPVLLEVASIGTGIYSDRTLNNRNKKLTADLIGEMATVDSIYNRVKEKYGKEEADAIRYGITEEEVEVINENGTSDKKKEKIIDEDKLPTEIFTVVYSKDTAREWRGNNEENMAFIRAQLSYAQNLINCKSRMVFINDILSNINMNQELFKALGQKYGYAADCPCDEVDVELSETMIRRTTFNGTELQPAVIIQFKNYTNLIDKMSK